MIQSPGDFQSLYIGILEFDELIVILMRIAHLTETFEFMLLTSDLLRQGNCCLEAFYGFFKFT